MESIRADYVGTRLASSFFLSQILNKIGFILEKYLFYLTNTQ